MKKVTFLLLLALFCGLATRSAAQSDTTMYTVYAYIKVAPKMEAQYLKLEKAYKKLHAANKKAGKMSDWSLTRVLSPSGAGCEYNYVARNAYKGSVQLAAFYEKDFMPKYWKTLLTPEEVALVLRTDEIRTLVKEEVFSTVTSVWSKETKPFTIAVYNFFRACSGI